jgi:galactokinase
MDQDVTAFAPGRVNLIGEHTDYNGGLALPFAIADGVTVQARPLAETVVRAFARDVGETDEFDPGAPPPAEGWRAFVRGAVAEMARDGAALPAGAELSIAGTVPQGGGMSSSAALSVSLCLTVAALSGRPPSDRLDLARACARVENDWVGAQTGLLDQLASLCGRDGHGVLIDFATLRVTPVEIPLAGHRLVMLASGQRHSNAGGGYNDRRAECAAATRELGVESLSDASVAQAERLPEPLRARALHVLSENARVRQTVDALGRGDLPMLGRLLNESHASLRDLYQVSTDQLEATRRAMLDAGALGARLVGGGFGGHVLGLLPPGVPGPDGAFEVVPRAGARLVGQPAGSRT